MSEPELSNKILSDITVYMKYARFLPEDQRRETWSELVTRNMNMHIKKYPNLEGEIREKYQLVYDKKVLPLHAVWRETHRDRSKQNLQLCIPAHK